MAENASNANPTQTTAVSEALKEEYKKQWPRGLDPESEKWPMWMVVLDEEARIFGMTTDVLNSEVWKGIVLRSIEIGITKNYLPNFASVE